VFCSFLSAGVYSCIGEIEGSVRRIVGVLSDHETCSVIRKELGSTPKRQGHEQEQEQEQEISLVATRNERWEEASGAGAAGKQDFKELVCVCVCVTYRVL